MRWCWLPFVEESERDCIACALCWICEDEIVLLVLCAGDVRMRLYCLCFVQESALDNSPFSCEDILKHGASRMPAATSPSADTPLQQPATGRSAHPQHTQLPHPPKLNSRQHITKNSNNHHGNNHNRYSSSNYRNILSCLISVQDPSFFVDAACGQL